MALGSPVTNAKGWHGKTVRRPPKWPPFEPLTTKAGTSAKPRKVVYVKWEERADHAGGDVLPHNPDDLTFLSRAE